MTKEELVIRNYTQKIALAKLALAVGANMSLGVDYDLLREDYRVAKQVQKLFDTEIVRSDYDKDLTHDCVATLHHLLSRWLPKGLVQITDSAIVPVGTLKQPPAVAHEIYYGWKPTSGALTVEEIEESDFLLAFPGVNYTLPFQDNQEYNYVWFAEPLTEPIKTDWEAVTNPLNKGQIGGNGNLFRSPIEIGDYRFYISNYATVMEEAIVFLSGGEVIPEEPEVITPSAPIVTGDDDANTLIATHPEFPTEIVVSENNGPFEPYTETIVVGDVDRPVGYWKFKIKAAENRNESSVVNSPEFTHVPVVVEQYTLTVNLTGQSDYTVYVNGSAISGNTAVYDEGTVLDVIVIKSGYEISPAIQEGVVMDGDKTLTFTATPVVVYRTLTVVVNGLSEAYEIWIDGVEQSTNTIQFVDGTILDNVSISVEGYTVEPEEVDGVVMDQNRTLVFTATPIQHELTINTGGITDYDVYIDDILHIGPLMFNQGTVLENVSLHKVGYTWSPSVQDVTMDEDKSISFTATAIPQYTLTVNVTGASDYTVRINGVNQTGNTFQYYEGTVIDDIRVMAEGFTFSPSVVGPLTMDGNKSINFIATEIPTFDLTINVTGTTGYTVTIDGEVQPSGVLTFNEGTILNNIVLSKSGWAFSPASVSTLTMNEDKVLNFTASEVVDGNYLPGFTAFNPKERYARLTQGGSSSLTEVEPGRWKVSGHRLDFIGYIRVPVGGEYAIKILGNESTHTYLNPHLPWSNEENKESYNITGLSAAIIGKDGYYGDGVDNRIEIRHWTNDGSYVSLKPQTGNWLLYRREAYNILNIYESDGFTETLAYSMDMLNPGPGGSDFMFIKHTIWDGDWLNYPQQRGCFHELNDTWPPAVTYNAINDTIVATHALGDSEILVSEDGGSYTQYTGPITVGNFNPELGHWKFKTKSASERPESIETQSPAVTKDILTEADREDLVFRGLNNLTYNPTTKTYSGITSGQATQGYNPDVYVPINASAAIYFPATLIDVIIGFNDSKNGIYGPNIPIQARIISYQDQLYVKAGGSETLLKGFVPETNLYRLVCRQISESRVWTLEESLDGINFLVIHTFTGFTFNDSLLYPVIGSTSWGVDSHISNLQWSLRLESNIEAPGELATPPAPTVVGNDTTNILSASHSLGDTEILVSENSAEYTQYTGPITVGNVNRAAGYWKFKTKATPERNESPVAESPAFTESTIPTYDLTINVTGTTGFTVTIDGVVQPSNIITVEENAVLENIVITKEGWTFDPASVASVTMDQDKTLTFVATEIPETNIMSGFAALDLTQSNGGTPTNTNGRWTGFNEIVLTGIYFPVDGELAFKTQDAVDCALYVSDTNVADNSGHGMIWDGVLSYFNGTDVNGAWGGSDYDFFILKRETENSAVVYFTDDGVSLVDSGLTITLPFSDTYLFIKAKLWTGGALPFPQGKNLAIEGTLSEVILVEDDVNNTITASHEDTEADIYVSENNGAYTLYTTTISVGNINRPAGYWKFEARKGLDISPIKNSSEFTLSAIEGLSDLTFSILNNTTYNSSTNTYSSASGECSARGSGNILPINGSGAIYFTGESFNMWAIFAVNENDYYNNHPIKARIQNWDSQICVVEGGSSGSNVWVGSYISGNDYRLVCRDIAGVREWTFETSADDWGTYTVLHTFTNEYNSSIMYPYIGNNDGGTLVDLRYEVYTDQNID